MTYDSLTSTVTVTVADPTGFLENGRVYLHFGSYGTACLDTTTFKELWRRTDLPCRHYRGPGSSVFPWKETLILTMDGVDVQYLAALDKKTGAEVWRKPRDERSSWSTPLVVEVGGKLQAIVAATNRTRSYDPVTGDIIWEAGGLTPNAVRSGVTA